jgi:hypothetical protein
MLVNSYQTIQRHISEESSLYTVTYLELKVLSVTTKQRTNFVVYPWGTAKPIAKNTVTNMRLYRSTCIKGQRPGQPGTLDSWYYRISFSSIHMLCVLREPQVILSCSTSPNSPTQPRSHTVHICVGPSQMKWDGHPCSQCNCFSK